MCTFKNLLISIFFFITLSIALAHAVRFDITNNCPYTIWAAVVLSESWPLDMNVGTTYGLIWAHIRCNFDGFGRGSCQTSNCGGLLQCQAYDTPPNTLDEFALNQYKNWISLTSLLLMGLIGCTKGNSCTADIDGQCPTKLRALGRCKNPCTVFKTDEYCCNSGNYRPTTYSKIFKDQCLDAYNYPKDDQTSTFTCNGGTDYKVVFCP
ncbi:hypothetical protein ACB098_10G063300 [Castanea mollissima]